VEILDSFARLDMTLGKIKTFKSGILRLSVVTTSKYFIPHLLGPFCQRFPDIDIQLNVGNRKQTIERLKQGIDDFYVFSHPPQDIDTHSLEFLSNPLVAIAHQDSAIAQHKTLSLKDICDEPFLMREKGSGTRYSIEAFLRTHKAKINQKMTIESNEAIKHCVMAKLGISILSAHTLGFGGQSNLVQLPIKELPIMSTWFFVWSKAKRQTLIAEQFLEHIQLNGQALLKAEMGLQY
jgi:DNA-binding transcriptional LysR family regulator